MKTTGDEIVIIRRGSHPLPPSPEGIFVGGSRKLPDRDLETRESRRADRELELLGLKPRRRG